MPQQQPPVQPLCSSFEWSVSGFDVSVLKDGADDVQASIAHETATPASATVSKGCFTGGSGSSAGDPVVICDYAGLKNMANGLNKHYVLGDHIDASASWERGSSGLYSLRRGDHSGDHPLLGDDSSGDSNNV